ncbi:hypothetical protein [uncultured Tenacibaculum sp.]|uniref:hypothetical protein n=1 Tax=uncultured Tenacibaculum sp. TaxID=174713 RepID=UPI002633092B|nr:hypothetical protein [uncultured Tenacibaculum sp.]
MKKITVKNLIEFRGKSQRSKITFVNNLKREKKKSEDSSGGGDYWIICLSAIRNTFRSGNKDLLDNKIEEFNTKIQFTKDKRIINQYQRNIDILINFKEYDLESIQPTSELNFLKQTKAKSILDINGLPIEAKPCFIYTFSEKGSEEIGGVWFIAKIKGFKKSELGMFTDILYRYLVEHYSDDYYVNPNYCIAVDLFNAQEVSYQSIEDKDISILIDSTLEDFKNVNNLKN